MPWVQDLSELNNMGVVLFTCITRTGRILVWGKKRLGTGRRRRALARPPESSPCRVLVVCIIAIGSPPERLLGSALSAMDDVRQGAVSLFDLMWHALQRVRF